VTLCRNHFPHEAESLTRFQSERNAVHRPQTGVSGDKIDFKIFDFEQRVHSMPIIIAGHHVRKN